MAWELLVVDNGSVDQTRQVVDEVRMARGLPLKYVLDSAPGISQARNAGIRAAHCEIVAFTDDDVVVDSGWLTAIAAEFAADPDLALLLGRTLPYTADLPALALKESTCRTRYRHPCSPRGIGNGNNMAIRTSTVSAVGPFDVTLGSGTRVGCGEDTDYIYRVLRTGGKVLYSPDPLIYHNHDRTTPEAVIARRLTYVGGWGALLTKFALRGDRWMARLLVSETARLAKTALRRRGARTRAVLRLWHFLLGAVVRGGIELRLALMRR